MNPKVYVGQNLRQLFVFKFIFKIHMLCADKIFQGTNTSFYFCQMAVEPHGSAIPVVNVTDSIRQVADDGNSIALSRASLRAVQTPQTFCADALINAYDVPYADFFTDDASVFEHAGNSVHLVDGDVNNIKITHPNDLMIAEYLLKQ